MSDFFEAYFERGSETDGTFERLLAGDIRLGLVGSMLGCCTRFSRVAGFWEFKMMGCMGVRADR